MRTPPVVPCRSPPG